MSGQTPKITPDEVKEKFEEKISELEHQAKEQETEKRALAQNLPYVNLKGFPISPEALKLIPEEGALKKKAVCFFYLGSEFRLGATAPPDNELKEMLYQIGERTHAKGGIYLISEASFKYAAEFYKRLPKLRPAPKGVAIKEEDLQQFSEEFRSFSELQERLQGVSVTDLVTLLIAAALRAQISDIHLEAAEKEVTARFRIDGILHTAAQIKKEVWPQLVSRVKLTSGLKINITDKPQDGRYTIFSKDGNVDVRVSTIPTAWGESVVMRLLRSTAEGLKFDDLGLRGAAFEQLKKEIARPNGMIITTGPTGSGKTTTLYAVLSTLNSPETKIITLEDPVEYKLAGIQQSQIDASKEYTFASGLRSILRQDPDVVMVGEIRDLETAEIAIQAALTGHLVLSTIHTNSAAGAIPRFLALGAKPFLLAPALNAVMAQRLVRKIHEECKEEVKLDAETLKRVKEILGALSSPPRHPERSSPKANVVEGSPAHKLDMEHLQFFRGAGCPKCFDLGYKGRVGIYEVMIMNKEFEEVILSGKISEYTMQELAVKGGMVTMVQDGLLKALDGVTTVEEVFSVAE